MDHIELLRDNYQSVSLLPRHARITKRTFDIVIATIMLVFLAPLVLVIGLIMLFDDGRPVVFRQTRTGFGGKPFVIVKLRTLETGYNGPNAVNDLRPTRFGGFLRRTSMDELPQLLNVIRGNMSMVGPRPHTLSDDDKFRLPFANYDDRFAVKPGVTGLAQVNRARGPAETFEAMQRRMDFDIEYIRTWSLMGDIAIIFKTAATVCRDDHHGR
jgi:lipopolysaccharide/colanic/teichoic acid biosynthesis glycosyltransferase